MNIQYTIKRFKDEKNQICENEFKNFFYSGQNLDLIVCNEHMSAVDIEIIELIESAGDDVMFGPAFDLKESRLQLKLLHNRGGESSFAKDSLGIYLRSKPISETKSLMAAMMSAQMACIDSNDIFAAEDYLVKKIYEYHNFRKNKK